MGSAYRYGSRGVLLPLELSAMRFSPRLALVPEWKREKCLGKPNQSLSQANRNAYKESVDPGGRSRITSRQHPWIGTALARQKCLSKSSERAAVGGRVIGRIRTKYPIITGRLIGISRRLMNSLCLREKLDDILVAFARRQRLCKVASTSYTDGLSATRTAKERIEHAVS